MYNIAQKMKEILETLPGVSNVSVDYVENEQNKWGLYHTSQNLNKEYITGDKQYLSNFALYYHTAAAEDTNRITNQNTLMGVVSALNGMGEIEVKENGQTIGNILKITATNPALFSVPVSLIDGYTYQIQIQAIYE